MRLHRRTGQHLRQRGLVTQAAERAAGRGVGEHHGTHLVVAQAGNDHILNTRGTRRNDLVAQRSYADKGAGGQLEVFGNAAIKLQAQVQVGFVNPLHRIARTEEAFFIEVLGGLLWGAPVTRCDVGAPVAQLGLVAHANQLDFQPRRGHPQFTGLDFGVGDKQGKRARFGHAQGGGHHHPQAQLGLL